MAHVFRFADYLQSSTVDLISGTFKLVDRSWATQSPGQVGRYDYVPFGSQYSFTNFEPVTETWTLIGQGNAATLLAALVEMQDVAENIRHWNDGKPTVDPWFLEWNADGESPKRSLIYRMKMQHPSEVSISPFFECQTLLMQISIDRHPLWENTVYTTQTDGNLLGPQTLGSQCNDRMVLTGINGTAPARIESMETYMVASANSETVNEYWIGIRPYHDGQANWSPCWQAEVGTIADADTTAPIDATASNSQAMHTTFAADDSLIRRFYVQLRDVAIILGNEIDYAGRYLVLARCKLDDTGTVGVQMRSGYGDNVIGEEVYVESTRWLLYELGEVEIPPRSDPSMPYGTWLRSFMVSIYAERIAGAATCHLNVDFLYFVPTEHFLYVSNSILAYNAANTIRDQVYTLPNDTNFAIGYTKGNPDSVNDALSIVPSNWYIPIEGGALVMIAQNETQHYLGETYSVSLEYYPRWLTYRLDIPVT